MWSDPVRSMRKAHKNELSLLCHAPWGDAKAMDRLRLERLRQTIVHAREQSPYYENLLSEAPSDPLETFRSAPVTTKVDIIASGLKRAVPPLPSETRLTGKTSGSSGQPFTFEIDSLLPSRHAAQRAYIYLRAGLSRKTKILEIVPGTRLELAPDITYPTFRRSLVGYSLEKLLPHVKSVMPTLLYGNRSHLLQVVDECQEEGIELSIPFVCSSSETVLPEDRKRLEEAFGCAIFEVYGSAEASNLAFYMPSDPDWTILEPRVWVEVLDASKKPVSAGEVGEIVVTTLTERTAPFIRYGTGDLARVSQGDGRGYSGMRLSSLEGRSSDSLLGAAGNPVSFWAVATAQFWGRPDIAARVGRWQIHQSPDRSLNVRLELLGNSGLDEVRSAVKDFLVGVVGALPVTVTPVERVHDAKQGKFRAVTSEAKR